MLFSCLPEGARIPGRFPGPPHPRGKHFTVDIHCHLLTEKAETMFKEAGLSAPPKSFDEIIAAVFQVRAYGVLGT